jgi:hypothetical protein
MKTKQKCFTFKPLPKEGESSKPRQVAESEHDDGSVKQLDSGILMKKNPGATPLKKMRQELEGGGVNKSLIIKDKAKKINKDEVIDDILESIFRRL